MKKIISVVLVAIFVACSFSGCGETKNEVYIGEGKMTVLRSLVATNGFIADEVFGANHLPVDMEKKITQGNQTYAPVVSDKIGSYAELETLLRSVYTEEVATALLNEPKKYIEIDGVLYFDLQYESTKTKKKYDWSEFEITFDEISENETQLFEVSLKKTNGWKTKLDIETADIGGMPRLCGFYN